MAQPSAAASKGFSAQSPGGFARRLSTPHALSSHDANVDQVNQYLKTHVLPYTQELAGYDTGSDRSVPNVTRVLSFLTTTFVVLLIKRPYLTVQQRQNRFAIYGQAYCFQKASLSLPKYSKNYAENWRTCHSPNP
jgi:hypothetical protein